MTDDATWVGDRRRHGGVDEIPLPGVAGRMWLCGKHYVAPDAERALRSVGADVVVCTNERSELEARYPDYLGWLADNEPHRAIWHPIPDLHAPPLDRATVLLTGIHARVADGHGVLLHCGAGIGRAGTLAAGLLITMGLPSQDALALVATHRPMAGPEAGAQAELLAELAADAGPFTPDDPAAAGSADRPGSRRT